MSNNYSNFEVLLVDNASADNSLKNAEEAFGNDKRMRIIRNSENLGFSGGNNVGYDASKGEYVVFLNNDTVVEPDWLTNLVRAMQNDSTIGLAQSKILMMNDEKIQTAGWLFSNYLVQKGALAENENGNLEFSSVFEVSVASGASMITRRELIERVGLFDSKVPFFYDDTLLSFKVWLANKRVVTVPSSKIRHMQGATLAWNLEATTFNLLRAKTCLLFDIYYGLRELARAAFVNFWHTSINSIYALRKKSLPVIYANIRCFTWALGNLRYLWTNRQKHWSNTKVSPQELKDKFVRINLPVALYLIPSKLSNDIFASAVGKYEHSITKS